MPAGGAECGTGMLIAGKMTEAVRELSPAPTQAKLGWGTRIVGNTTQSVRELSPAPTQAKLGWGTQIVSDEDLSGTPGRGTPDCE